MTKKNIIRILLLQSAVLLQVGCSSYVPTELPKDPSQPQGPGLFSGEDGCFEIDFGR